LQLSVVVPAFNAAHCLERVVEALRRAMPDGAELVIVDDQSSDGTGELARRLADCYIRQDVRQGPGAARNRGAEVARGPLIAFVDSDVVVHDDALRIMLDVLNQDDSVAAVFGSYDDRPDVSGSVARYRNLLHHHIHQTSAREAGTFWSGCGMLHKLAFAGVGGFDVERFPEPSIEDIDLGLRLRDAGYRIVLERRALCTHLKEWTLSSMFHTDVFKRAAPWTKLMLQRERVPSDLNTGMRDRVSATLVLIAIACLVLSVVDPKVSVSSLVAISIVAWLNRGLLARCVSNGGIRFGVRCLGLHLIYLTYASATFACVWIANFLTLQRGGIEANS